MDPSIHNQTPVTADGGQLGHPQHIKQSERLTRQLFQCGDHAWCYVGNGLSNQTFVEGPEGIIAIDTGECTEEMQAALAALREHTDKPIVACIYSHFHYVSGTRAILEEMAVDDLEIHGHAGIADNLRRFGGEVGPRSARGLVHQFGVMMPAEGEAGLINVGLGRFFRNPEHAPYSHGYLPVNQPFESPVSRTIGGLTVEMVPAPSDATDSITIWFPELGLCVNNLVWPALFNVFAIRGEEYRDPRILLKGLEHIESLPVDHLLCTHGPPLSGREEIRHIVQDYSDSIRFLWDQTVRGVNRGLTLDELTRAVVLPDSFSRTYFTRQLYGLVEHHVKQIHSGLFGWFDEDPLKLFPLEPTDRAKRIVEGFGGVETVREKTQAACDAEDFRWAIELASYLVKVTGEQEDSNLLARALKQVGYRTTSANIRNWCVTRALDLEGQLDMSRHRQHRFGYREVLAAEPTAFVPVLRVLLDPDKAGDLNLEIRWVFDSGEQTGLRIRNRVGIPTTGEHADIVLTLDLDTWALLLSQKATLSELLGDGRLTLSGDKEQASRFFACFDLASFQS